MNILHRTLMFYLLFTGMLFATCVAQTQELHHSKSKIKNDVRLISIDNVCAWPNLTVLSDGSIVATIFNQPSHARAEGDVECWASTDGGKFWEKRGVPARHIPNTNRMNVAAGLATNGDLVVVASGWSLQPAEDGKPPRPKAVMRAWVSRSSDGGRSWHVRQEAFPPAEKGMTEFIPFGDILTGSDGSLRVLAYAQTLDREVNKVYMFRSRDDGKSWHVFSVVSDGNGPQAADKGHNETAFFHLGGGRWIAAARRWQNGQALDLLTSTDDGRSWKYDRQLTEANQHPAHIQRLKDGRLLLTYGNRIAGEYGVAVKFSDDDGKTWGPELLLVDDLLNRDCGYPSSVQLPDGRILTAYYSSGAPEHTRYHMGTVVWQTETADAHESLR